MNLKSYFLAVLVLAIDYALDAKLAVKFIEILPGSRPNADKFRDIFELLESRGFQHESHFVTSADGYITQLIRIRNPLVKDRSKLKPVMLVHGFSCTGAVFLIGANGSLHEDGRYYEYDENGDPILDPNNVGTNLGFVLASREFDVWLPELRGNSYSTNHTDLDLNSSEFWSFSMDEMIDYDVPVWVDYVRNVTGRASVGFVGHSLANTMMLGLLSKRAEYADRVKPFISLSPVFYMHKTATSLRFFAPIHYILRQVPGSYPKIGYIRNLYSTMCENIFLRPIFDFLYYHAVGSHQKDFYRNRMGVYLSNVFRYTSTFNAAQGLQLLQHGQPSYMDYGRSKNLLKYNSETPPLYNASMITSKHLAFFYTKYDLFSHMDCIDKLKKDLKVQLLEDYLVEDPEWNHMELVWGKTLGLTVNKRIIELLATY